MGSAYLCEIFAYGLGGGPKVVAEGTCGTSLAGALPEEFAGHVGGVCKENCESVWSQLSFEPRLAKALYALSHIILREKDVLVVMLLTKRGARRG